MNRRELLKALGLAPVLVEALSGRAARAEPTTVSMAAPLEKAFAYPSHFLISLHGPKGELAYRDYQRVSIERSPACWRIEDMDVLNNTLITFPRCNDGIWLVTGFGVGVDADCFAVARGDLSFPLTLMSGIQPVFDKGSLRIDGGLFA